jgi:topoisomerase IA-like protein
MKPIDVPIENMTEDMKKQFANKNEASKTPEVSPKIENSKFVIKVGKNGMYMEPSAAKDKEERENMKSELMKEVEDQLTQK